MNGIDNQAFNDACDYVKKTEGITFNELCEKLDLDRVEFNNIRSHKKNLPMNVQLNLLKLFPSAVRFFETKPEEMTLEVCKNKLIEKLENEIHLLKENHRLRSMVNDLQNELNKRRL